MSIHPVVINAARLGWKWQWNQLMNGLAPADKDGNYLRPPSQHLSANIPLEEDLKNNLLEETPHLIIGRSCPWAHRTWLVHQMKGLENSLKILFAKADHKKGQWLIEPTWMGCNSLLDLYKKCNSQPTLRATVPVLIQPKSKVIKSPQILGNESAQLVEVLNEWPTNQITLDFSPPALNENISYWQDIIQPAVNNGVYRCGFARTQKAYKKASNELFEALDKINKSLSNNGPWLCGEQLTLADIRLFPTLIRWETVYAPLFGCTKEPLWRYHSLWQWRKRFFALPFVAETCDSKAWRIDYFGALFPLRPNSIIPDGPDLISLVNESPLSL